MGTLLLALGLAICIEGLVIALAPAHLERMLETLRELPPDSLRMVGLTALSIGVALCAAARWVGV